MRLLQLLPSSAGSNSASRLIPSFLGCTSLCYMGPIRLRDPIILMSGVDIHANGIVKDGQTSAYTSVSDDVL